MKISKKYRLSVRKQEDELIYLDHILNSLSDQLYNLYTNTTLTKEIWEVLENKYKVEEEETRNF